MPPRIPPVAPTGNPPDIQEILTAVAEATGGAENVFRTIAHNPGLFRRFAGFSGRLFAGRLPARDREIIVLRVGWLCRSEYEIAQHVRIGRAAGLSDGEIDALLSGTAHPAWGARERAIVDATDELVATHTLTAQTWNAVSALYDRSLMIEFLLLVGNYVMLAGFLNAVGVEVEARPSGPGGG